MINLLHCVISVGLCQKFLSFIHITHTGLGVCTFADLQGANYFHSLFDLEAHARSLQVWHTISYRMEGCWTQRPIFCEHYVSKAMKELIPAHACHHCLEPQCRTCKTQQRNCMMRYLSCKIPLLLHSLPMLVFEPLSWTCPAVAVIAK